MDDTEDDRPFAEVGRLVLSAGVIESNLRVLNALLLGSANAGVVVAGQNADTLMSNAVALAEAHSHVSAELLDSLKVVLRGCRRLLDQRNHLVHGLWVASDATAAVLRSRYRRLVHESMAMPTAEQLQALVGEFEFTSIMIFVWILAFAGEELTVEDDTLRTLGGLPVEETEALLRAPVAVIESLIKVLGKVAEPSPNSGLLTATPTQDDRATT